MKRLIIIALALLSATMAQGQTTFSGITLPDHLCAGDTQRVHFGYNPTDEVLIYTHVATLAHSERVFLPDGVSCPPHGCAYQSPINFTHFIPGSTITSVEDIRYVRLNIEHSYIGDLYIKINCPNGQSADILRYGGSGSSSCNSSITSAHRGWVNGNNGSGGTFFGLANDTEDSGNKCDSSVYRNRPGTPWNYCWSNNTTEGYTYGANGGYVYRTANIHTLSGGWDDVVDSSNVAAGTQFYHPDENFQSLVGCPLNGNWSITVQDGWSMDNGWLFEWEMSLQANVTQQDTCLLAERYMSGPFLSQLNDSLFAIQVPSTLTHDTTAAYLIRMTNTCNDTTDTVVYIHIHPNYSYEFDTVACDEYTFEGTHYTSTLQHDFAGQTQYGCDSTVHIGLIINHSDTISMTDTVCDRYLWNGTEYSSSGTYSLLTANQFNCDSLSLLNLTVNRSDTTTLNEVECDRYQWNDTVFTSSGTYIFPLRNQANCDSTVHINLTINYSDSIALQEVVCDSFLWNGTNYTTGGTYRVMTNNQFGCDSLTQLFLTIHYSHTNTITDGGCEQYRWNDSIYTASGYYTRMTRTTFGCDSIMELHLTIDQMPQLKVDTSEFRCEDQFFELMAYTDAENLTWSAQPTDASLHGQEHQDLIHVSPQTTTQYTAMVKSANELCVNTQSLLLLPIPHLEALMRIEPENATADNQIITLKDRSKGNIIERLWLADEEYVGDKMNQEYRYPAGHDSVGIQLIVTESVYACRDTAYGTIHRLGGSLWAPNAFTPDEAINREFRIYGDKIVYFELDIYARNGQLVFHSDKMEMGWDGRNLSGFPCPQASYAYIVRYAISARPKELQIKKGTVTLLR